MSALSDYLENKLLDHLLGGGDYSPAGTLYVALYTAAPSDSGGGTEVSGGSYARTAVTNNTTNFPSASSGSKSNANAITFPTATGSWGTVTHFGILDASSGGNLLAWGALSGGSIAPTTGDTVSFDAGALVLSLAGAFGSSVRNGLLDLAFGAVSYSRPSTVYAALFTAPPSASGGGTEVSGGSYARTGITNNTTNFPSASGGAKSNGTQITFPTATAAWGTITDAALFDSLSGGNLLLFATLSASRVINSGNTFRFAATAFAPSLN
jgi:hypothetical protein